MCYLPPMASEPISEHHLLLGIGIKWHRELLGISQEEMINDTSLHIGQYERGLRNISLSNLKKAADYLGTTSTGLLIFADCPGELTPAQREFMKKHLPAAKGGLPLAAEKQASYKKHKTR